MAKKKTRVTYGRVIAVLRDLGYVPDLKRSAKTYTVFVHPEREGSIILPVLGENEIMRATYLAMITRVLSTVSNADAIFFGEKTSSEGLRDSRGVLA